jgi:M6 family metalloprotease-like protein
MRQTIYRLCLLFLMVIGSVSEGLCRPAFRKPIETLQPDGTTLTILLNGDEFGHVARSTDGYILKENEDGFFTFAIQDTDGTLRPSNKIARNTDERDQSTTDYLKNIPKGLSYPDAIRDNILSKRIQLSSKNKVALRSASTSSASKAVSATPPGLLVDYPRTGTPKSLVILVNFSDKSFQTANTASTISDRLNQVGYSLDGHVGSVRDYYKFNSGGLFIPDYVVVGPVTVSGTAATYGANDSDGNDVNPELMVQEACILANSLVDYSQFDFDNDGYVDNVFVYYAGKGEADGGGSNTIWPHSYQLSASGKRTLLDGKYVDAYACSNELNNSTNKLDGIGAFTHEYGHILGLADMYDVDYSYYNGQASGLDEWSLMADGSYNNNSCTPPCLTIVERYLLGWASPVELDTSQHVTLQDLGLTNQGYLLKTKNDDEYFLLENRQQSKNVWDNYLPYHGMLVYHIDLRSDATMNLNYWGTTYEFTFAECWEYNMVNASSKHQCCDLEEADNAAVIYDGYNYSSYMKSLRGDPFPGTSGNTSLTDATAPSTLSWGKVQQGIPMTEISENNSIISFNFKDFSDFKNPPKVLEAKNILPFSFTANWQSVPNATHYYLDVFTKTPSEDSMIINYVDSFQNKKVVDTLQLVYVPYDKTTYYYQVRAANQSLTTANSDSIDLYVPDGTIAVQAASMVEDYTFRANWQKADYATAYFVDVFTIDEWSGDTTYLEGCQNYRLVRNYLVLSELEDQTEYRYRVRGTNGYAVSSNSNSVILTTDRASEITAYAIDRIIWLKGMDKGGQVIIHYPNGTTGYASNVNHIAVNGPGIYLITARYNGKEKHIKLLVQ